MAVIVQKYGGTSVRDIERIQNVARRIKETYDAGNQVVVVVSARSGVTNELTERAKALNPRPNARELDMLLSAGEQETIALTAIALDALGIEATSRTGAQAGIITDQAHTRARIKSINCGDIPDQLAAGRVVIVAGFQGVNEAGQTTTLGRGGSDLSAIALAAALDADLCQIFTDVPAVFTADPRVVPDASKISQISYEEMLELASLGSKVMQARAVEFAQKYNVPFEVRSSFESQPGTIVKSEVPSMEDVLVSGMAIDKNQAIIRVSGLPDAPGSAARVFEALSKEHIIVDMIMQTLSEDGVHLSFTVNSEDVAQAQDLVAAATIDLGDVDVINAGNIAKLSVVGVGMRSHSGVAETVFRVLGDLGVNIQVITTSEIKISVAVGLDQVDAAARAVHEAFKLEKPAEIRNDTR